MKVGTITKPNVKGQVVIPKEMRDSLGITTDMVLNLVLVGNGIYIYPITEILTKSDSDNSYLQLLAKTKGSWSDEDWDELPKTRSKFELKASQSRKNSW